MLSCGPNPVRPGLAAIGMSKAPDPVAGLAENFSPMPRIAPPLLGKLMDGREPWLSSERGAGAASIVPTRAPGADAWSGSIFASPSHRFRGLVWIVLGVGRTLQLLSAPRSRTGQYQSLLCP